MPLCRCPSLFLLAAVEVASYHCIRASGLLPCNSSCARRGGRAVLNWPGEQRLDKLLDDLLLQYLIISTLMILRLISRGKSVTSLVNQPLQDFFAVASTYDAKPPRTASLNHLGIPVLADPRRRESRHPRTAARFQGRATITSNWCTSFSSCCFCSAREAVNIAFGRPCAQSGLGRRDFCDESRATLC